MKNKTKFKTITLAIFATLLMLVAFASLFIMQASTIQAEAYSATYTHEPSKRLSAREAFADSNFEYDSINIVLTATASRQFLDYSASDFIEINATGVVDLTHFTVGYVREQFRLKQQYGIAHNREQSELTIDIYTFRRILMLTFDNDCRESIFDKIDILNTREDVYVAEPNARQTISSTSPTLYTQHWNNNMRNLIGYNGLNAFRNAPSVIVGVMDTGIQSSHAILNSRMHRGYPTHDVNTTWHRDFSRRQDLPHGRNVVNPVDTGTSPTGVFTGHGTQTAGIIASMHPNVRLVCIKVLPATGAVPTTPNNAIALAINYAQSRGIQILNFSGAGFNHYTAVIEAINSFTGIFVNSAANFGRDNDNQTYLNLINQSRILTVGAHDNNGQRSVWGNYGRNSSNFGTRNVHIFAPGGGIVDGVNRSILTTAPTGSGFGYYSGTSAAAPFVAGTLALMRALRPDLPISTIRSILLNNAENQSITVPVWHNVYNKLLTTYQEL